jgi:2-polyprenyl-3-methyl-5-hydroxy-6-metoxy-1,4-benzoquinol methylase
MSYFFGEFCIPLPDSGVFLLECTNCSLLFKSSVPNRVDLTNVISIAATKVWHPKNGIHPAVELVKPYFNDITKIRILDIGASNGDLLTQLKEYASCLSALDIVAYPPCENIVDGEYIIGNIEEPLVWSGKGYDIVTAFDIFEHFLDTKSALQNISSLLLKGGILIIETGDWTYFEGDLGSWYYANLFEHQIFWSYRAITYMCDKFGFQTLEYRRVQHKNIRNLPLWEQLLLNVVVKCASFSWFRNAMLLIGNGDPSRFIPPTLKDHAFIVLKK